MCICIFGLIALAFCGSSFCSQNTRIDAVNNPEVLPFIRIDFDDVTQPNSPTRIWGGLFLQEACQLNPGLSTYLKNLPVCPKSIGVLKAASLSYCKRNNLQLGQQLLQVERRCLQGYRDDVNKKCAEAIVSAAENNPDKAFVLVFDNPDSNVKQEISDAYRSHFFIRHLIWINGYELHFQKRPNYLQNNTISVRSHVPRGHSCFAVDLNRTHTVDLSAEGQRLTTTMLLSALSSHNIARCNTNSFWIEGINHRNLQSKIASLDEKGNKDIHTKFAITPCVDEGVNAKTEPFTAAVEFLLEAERPGVYVPLIMKIYVR